MSGGLVIREIGADEFARAWPIFRAVIAGGDTCSHPPGLAEAAACAMWTTAPSRCFVAERGGDVLGVYMLRPNQPGLGDHVAHCGYMVSPAARGQGIASALCGHSLAEARRGGSAPCSTTSSPAATKARCACGSATASRSSAACRGAFRHAVLGPSDAYVMHRAL